ncbi:MAG: glycosyltransferase family 4 protein [Acidobacteriota bacterium]|nr:glycosyltransferase family 4 protein [Acidobacteriota bacterium]
MRIAVISPFLDRSHGTERCAVEQLERFHLNAETQIHVYAQRIKDLRNVVRYKSGTPQSGQLLWHKVPAIPGPHLFQFIFWFFANRIFRWFNAHFRHVQPDVTLSHGINAVDVDAAVVHIVFTEFYRLVRPQLSFRRTPLSAWPRLLHRRLYYRLIMALEKRVYGRPDIFLAAVSGMVGTQLKHHFNARNIQVVRYGVDAQSLSVARRLARRDSARQQFGLAPADFVLLLIGNDWKKKGLDALLNAVAQIRELPWKLLVVGTDTRAPYDVLIRNNQIVDRVVFLPPSPDVLQFYAATDAYVGPSLEDAYALPILEAMAGGLPVIASASAGASEIIVDGTNGIILRDPHDAQELSVALRSLINDPALCLRLGAQAAITAQQQTWGANAEAAWQWLSRVQQAKKSPRHSESASQ